MTDGQPESKLPDKLAQANKMEASRQSYTAAANINHIISRHSER